MLSILLISFLIMVVLEYVGHFGTKVRSILFYGYIILNAIVIIRYILFPFLSLLKIGKHISYTQAAHIIGSHFENVADKLLNALQLEQLHGYSASEELLLASIDQKTQELKKVPFNLAIDFKKNLKYVKFALIPLLVILMIYLGKPEVIKEPGHRIVAHNMYFEKPSPFGFHLLNKNLQALKGEDFDVKLEVESDLMPDAVYILLGSQEYQMKTSRKQNHYSFGLKKIQKNVSIQFRIGKYLSQKYDIKVLPKPVLQKFVLKVKYPAYTGLANEAFNNIGDLTVPEGTHLYWDFYTDQVNYLFIKHDDQAIRARQSGKNHFSYDIRCMQSFDYMLMAKNEHVSSSDSLSYRIQVQSDEYPSIRLQKEEDSLNPKFLFFNGQINDDYGFSRFRFVYTRSSDTLAANREHFENLAVQKSVLSQSFNHYFDMNMLNLQPGEQVTFYFEVWDNDGINGSKRSVSEKFVFQSSTVDELKEKSNELSENVKSGLKESILKAQKLQTEFEEARKKMLEKKKLNWEDKKYLENLLEKQKDLQEEINDIKKDYLENLNTKDEYEDFSEEMLKKYEQLSKMFEEVLPEEIKKLYDELDKLLEENKKNQVENKLDKGEMSNKELEKELDRMLEMYKRFEVESKTEELTKQINELAKKQEELADKLMKDQISEEDAKEKQERLNEDFKDAKKELDELNKLNKELENPFKMEDFEQEKQDVDKEQNESLKQLQQQKRKKAAGHQKNAAEKMKEMAEKMEAMQKSFEMKSLEINIEKLRQILDNLLHLSFSQEQLMSDFEHVSSYNPKYVALSRKQQDIRSDAQMIIDSLYALGKEVPMIQSYITKEANELNKRMGRGISELAGRNVLQARKEQQFAMTAANNLAVMLSEVLDQMQKQMANAQMSSSGNKPKKNGNKPGLSDLRKLQENLNKQIEDMKKGKMPGMGKMNKSLARMAAQQEMLRNKLRQLQEQKEKEGNKPGGDLDKIQELMEETEKDLVHKRITSETLKRQKEITVKLLEAEKAEKEQEKDEKRKSKSAEQFFKPKPPSLEEYLKQKEKQSEILYTYPPELNPFYKARVKEYYRLLNQTK